MPLSQFKNRVVVLLVTALVGSAASAQDTTTYEEQYKRIKAPNAVTQLGPELFGEAVNLYTGGLEFRQTDVSLRGNNQLPVAVGRRLRIESGNLGGRAFGRWDLDIPHMHGIFPKKEGWITGGTDPNQRCSQYMPPPVVRGTTVASLWDSDEYWNGSYLYVPGQGDQRVLRRSSAIPELPRSTYPLITSKLWAISCTPALDSDTTAGKTQGDGFVATSPDGTRYTFNWMTDFPVKQLTKPNDAGGTPYRLARKEVWILPTLVTDRFGNWVRYAYDCARRREYAVISPT